MDPSLLPTWTLFPFAALVLAMASLPVLWPGGWEQLWVQALLVLGASAPVLWFLLEHGETRHVLDAGAEYVAFVAMLGALFVTAGGIYVNGDLRATPRTNVLFLLGGSLLASVIGTTGASMLVLRPLLRTNSERERTSHLVPFVILAVANAGGLLTPLGDPPLLVGYLSGVPFFWTLRLFPAWVLYVGCCALGLYVVDRHAYRRETPAALERDRRETRPLSLEGKGNVVLLLAVVPAALLPPWYREALLFALAALSYLRTPRELHRRNQFSLAPIVEVALLFAGLFACLLPVELTLAAHALELPLRKSWQLFWAAGGLSAVLDNAPTYAAFVALGRGLGAGRSGLVAGVDPLLLAAVSVGSVVMGAMTYIGNAPNLMVKAVAERSGYGMPSFFRFALFAFVALLPAHLVMTVAFIVLER